MALSSLLKVGMPILYGGTAAGINLFTLDSANDAVQAVFQAPADDTITHLWFRQGTLTGVAPVFRVSLQGVNSTGEPDGTIKGGGTAKNDHTPIAGNDGLGVWVALDTPYVCTRGEYLAINIARFSGTIDGSNNCGFAYAGASDEPDQGFPYAYLIIDGAPSKIINASPIYGYKSATRTYGIPTVTRSTFSSALATTPDERAVKFTLPAGWGVSYKIAGVRFWGSMATGGSNVLRLRLYDTDGTSVLQEAEHNTRYAGSTDLRWFEIYFDDATLATLLFGSTYRLSMRSNGTNAIVIGYLKVTDSGDMGAFSGGTALSYSERTDDGSWTDDPTQRLTLDILIDDWTGSGGGIGALVGGSLIR